MVRLLFQLGLVVPAMNGQQAPSGATDGVIAQIGEDA